MTMTMMSVVVLMVFSLYRSGFEMAGNGLDAFAGFLGDFFVIVFDHIARFVDFLLNDVAGFLAALRSEKDAEKASGGGADHEGQGDFEDRVLSFDMVFFLASFYLPQDVTGREQYEREVSERGRKKFRGDQRGRLGNFDGNRLGDP